MGQLDSKVALVTGASRWIGKAIALKFASEGADVAFSYIAEGSEAEELRQELEQLGVRAKGYKSNAADFSECEELIKNIVEDFGSLEIIVNNAGITRDSLLLRMSEECWDEVLQTNLKGVFFGIKSASLNEIKLEKNFSFLFFSKNILTCSHLSKTVITYSLRLGEIYAFYNAI